MRLWNVPKPGCGSNPEPPDERTPRAIDAQVPGRHARSLLVAAAALLVGAEASALPRPLPFTYDYETLGEGEVGVEQ
jgi:hypothetical protein